MARTMHSLLDPVQTLRCHDPLHRDAASGGMPVVLHSIARTSSSSKFRPTLPKRKSSDYLLEPAPPQRKYAFVTSPTSTSHDDDAMTFVFTAPNHARHKGFEFATAPSRISCGTKRCRLGSDVDGPNTAALCRKKRRLRAHLITSRLSQPYSQPATHISNRQGKQVGDKRFLKMATTIDISRRAAHLQTTCYLRYSVMNCLRRSLGIVKHQGSARDSDVNPVRHGMDTSAKAPWQPQPTKPAQEPAQEPAPAPESKQHLPPLLTTGAPISTPGVETPAKAPACRLSKPAALPLPSADVAATKDRTSPRIDSPSPEPRPPLSWMYDDHEEDGFAFLHLDEEHLGDDEPEHVYCDFDVLFGAKSPAPSDPQSPEDHTYEEYMDELDGISWRIG